MADPQNHKEKGDGMTKGSGSGVFQPRCCIDCGRSSGGLHVYGVYLNDGEVVNPGIAYHPICKAACEATPDLCTTAQSRVDQESPDPRVKALVGAADDAANRILGMGYGLRDVGAINDAQLEIFSDVFRKLRATLAAMKGGA